jgi:hypothetical protein
MTITSPEGAAFAGSVSVQGWICTAAWVVGCFG